jgi:GDP-4-dehydro-6-deoxy-D-mannose reductase
VRILVTGVTGFAGPFVARALQAAGHDCHGLARGGPNSPAGVPIHDVDLRDGAAVAGVVAQVAPEAVVHLAAWASPATAETDPAAAYAVNVGGTLAVLGAMRAHAPRARLLLVSSCLVYGALARPGLPVGEDAPLRPVSVYGASKAAAEIAALQWYRAYGLDVVVARPFNHTGPGQAPDYVCSALARQVAAIEAGRQPPVLEVGNPDPVRDFGDVRDVAEAYRALLERGRAGEAYNVCTGEGASVAEVIAQLRVHARVPLRVHVDPKRAQGPQVDRLVGDRTRIGRDTGWAPRIPLTDTLRDLLDAWRATPA